MSEIIELHTQDYSSLAEEKLKNEATAFVGDQKCRAIKDHVLSTLIGFCKQNNDFARVVYKTAHTLSDCCEDILCNCGNYISDIDVYRGAVRNYFPNAEVEFLMNIIITGEAPSEKEMAETKPKSKPKKEPEKKPNPPKKTPPAPKPESEAKKVAKKNNTPEILQLSLF